jgi:hypothetical protein
MHGNRPWPLTESPSSRAALQRVVIEPFRFCGGCYFCERGQTNLCELGEMQGCNAGLQQYVAIDCSLVHTIHEGVPRSVSPSPDRNTDRHTDSLTHAHTQTDRHTHAHTCIYVSIYLSAYLMALSVYQLTCSSVCVCVCVLCMCLMLRA